MKQNGVVFLNELCKKRLETIMLRLSSKADISYDHCTKVVPRVITSKKQF